MASPWLAVGAGASQGLEDLIARTERQKQQEVLNAAVQARDAETRRSNLANETLHGQQIGASAEANRLSALGLQQQRAALDQDRNNNFDLQIIKQRPTTKPEGPPVLVDFNRREHEVNDLGIDPSSYGKPIIRPPQLPLSPWKGTFDQQAHDESEFRLKYSRWIDVDDPENPGRTKKVLQFFDPRTNGQMPNAYREPTLEENLYRVPPALSPDAPEAQAPQQEVTRDVSKEPDAGPNPAPAQPPGPGQAPPSAAASPSGQPPSTPLTQMTAQGPVRLSPQTAAMRAAIINNKATDRQIGRVAEMFNPEWVGRYASKQTTVQSWLPEIGDLGGMLSKKDADSYARMATIDPARAEFESAVSSVNNIMIKLRSGATVTPAEWERLRSEFPQLADQPDVFLRKLANMSEVMNDINAVLSAEAKAGSNWKPLDNIRGYAKRTATPGAAAPAVAAPAGAAPTGAAPSVPPPAPAAAPPANESPVDRLRRLQGLPPASTTTTTAPPTASAAPAKGSYVTAGTPLDQASPPPTGNPLDQIGSPVQTPAERRFQQQLQQNRKKQGQYDPNSKDTYAEQLRRQQQGGR